MIYALIAAVAYAFGIAHCKWLLDRTKLTIRELLSFQFLILFLGSSFLMPWLGHIEPQFFEVRNLFLFGFVILVGIICNYFWSSGMKRESIHEYELIDLLMPVFAICLAALTYVDERDPSRLLLAVVAAGVFLVVHLSHWQFDFKRQDRRLLFAIFLMGMEVILFKPLLELASPVAIYTIRTGIIACIFFFLFRPRLSQASLNDWFHIGVNSILGLVKMIFWLTAVQLSGIVATELVMLIAPIILGVISLVFFHERWSFRQSVAFAVILVCVALVYTLQ